MNHSDYKQLQTAWDAIERLEHLESLIDRRRSISFVAQLAPSANSLPCTNPATYFALTPEMNQIVLESLMEYKEDLKARMAAIELNDTMVAPIEQ